METETVWIPEITKNTLSRDTSCNLILKKHLTNLQILLPIQKDYKTKYFKIFGNLRDNSEDKRWMDRWMIY